MKIHDAIDRSMRTNHPVVDAKCVQAIIDGFCASSDKSRSTRYLYDKAKALSETERPKTPEAMIDWVVTTMRNVKVAIETASLNGYFYDVALQLHHKKPGIYLMHRDLTKQVGGGGKTAKTPAPATTPPLCNICGGNHTMDACRRKGSWQGVEGTTRLQLAPEWTNGHPRQLREKGRTREKEGSKFPRVVEFT
jgi:hypothetical protein